MRIRCEASHEGPRVNSPWSFKGCSAPQHDDAGVIGMTVRRVLMTTDAAGGVWHYATALADVLVRGGLDVRLAVIGDAPSAGEAAFAAARNIGLDVLDVPLDWHAESAAALEEGGRKIADAAGAWGADLLHLNQPAYGGADCAVPVVAVAHSCVTTWWRGTRGMEVPEDWHWHRDAVRAGLAAADVAVAPSASFAAMLEQAYRLDDIRVVHNGTRPRGSSVAKRPLILAAGRGWDESKNFAVLDRAATQIPWPVRLAGTCLAPGDGGRARFPNLRCVGHLDRRDMARELDQAAIFVAPSLYEPLGLAVLEAAHAGAVLLLSRIATFRELWEDSALFFDPEDPDHLARQARRLIGDEALRRRLSAAARARARRFSIDRTAEEMRGLYQRIAHEAEMEAPA